MATIRAERPSSSQEDVAAEARERWKLAGHEPLGFSMLVKHLRSFERDGTIPAQKPE